MHYINIPQYEGSYPVPGAVASSDSTDSTRATFSDGRILGHAQGVAVVTLTMQNGDIEKYYVSVYYKYPQPKTAIVYASGAGEKLSKWGKAGNSDYVTPDRALVSGERLTLLWRAHDQDDTSNNVYQYARTSDGKEGYVSDAWTSDRPMGGYYGGTFGVGYFNDVAVGENGYISSEAGGVPKEDSTSWSSSDASVLRVTMKSDGNGNANQGFIEGIKEGHAIATTVLEYNGANFRSSSGITVYTKWPNVQGRTTGATYIRGGAYADATAAGELSTGESITISGESGAYYRISQSRYVLKSAVAIPATGVSVSPSAVQISSKGDGKWQKLAATLRPQVSGATVSTSKVAWSVADPAIATVDSKGKVTGVKEGKTTVTAAADSARADIAVTVKNIHVSKITLDKTSIKMNPGEKQQIKATAAPKNAYNKKLVWTASPADIVAITDKGNNTCEINAVKSGKATITAATEDGSVKASCAVTVREKASADVLDNKDLDLRIESYKTAQRYANYTFKFNAVYYHNPDVDGYSLAKYYRLERKARDSSDTDFVTVSAIPVLFAGTKTIIDRTALNGVYYIYHLKVYDKENGSWKREESLTTGHSPIKKFMVHATSSKKIKLTWKKKKMQIYAYG